jgi:NAD-dependent deacetylase sirtuin 5
VEESQAASLSNVKAFETNPGFVWNYFADRRRLVLRASVNDGYKALAGLAKKKREKARDFVCLTQNIDGDLRY